jgi:ABC-type transport system substrate-binding protein
MIRLVVAAAVLGPVIAACGSTPATPPAAPPSTVTVQNTVPVTTVPPAVPKMCTVPDVVGKIHQDAQNAMQAAGLYLLKELDASGQGRLLINDRNWRTTAQSVAAGTSVACTTEVTLTAEKIS